MTPTHVQMIEFDERIIDQNIRWYEVEVAHMDSIIRYYSDDVNLRSSIDQMTALRDDFLETLEYWKAEKEKLK